MCTKNHPCTVITHLILNIWSTLKNVAICKIFCYNYFSFLGANGRQLRDEQIAINLVPIVYHSTIACRSQENASKLLHAIISLQKQHVCLTKNSVTSVAVQCHRIHHQVTMPDLFVATDIYESQPLQCVASTVHCTVKPCSCELCLSQGHVHVTLTI